MNLVYSASLSKAVYVQKTNRKTIVVEKKRTKILIYQKSKKDTFIAFRGTHGIEDVFNITDSFFKKPYEFHMREDCVKINTTIFKMFKDVEKELYDYLLPIQDTNVIFCGHSLGGGIAEFASSYYASVFPCIYFTCHTFGTPIVGDNAFYEWHKKRVDSIKFANSGDLVPYISLIPFNDIKKQNLVKIKTKNVLKSHHAASYIQGIKTCLL